MTAVLTAGHTQSGQSRSTGAVIIAETELGQSVVPLLQVEILEVVREEVQVLGGWIEVVIDGDAHADQVCLAVARWQVLELGLGHLPERLGHGELITGPPTSSPTTEGPDDADHDQEDDEDGLEDDQLPGGVHMLA